MKLSWLLFDIDNTLLDFNSASKKAFFRACENFKVECNDELYYRYKKINTSVWEEFERGDISAIALRSLRFERFFTSEKINPCAPLEFNSSYLSNLIDASEYYENVPEMLTKWSAQYKLSIVTNGLKEVQRARLEKLDLSKYFDSIVVSDEIGHAKPSKEYFDYTFNSIENTPPKSETLIIGDSLMSDILGGINAGIKTCWVHHGRKNEAELSIDYEIENIQSLPSLLETASFS